MLIVISLKNIVKMFFVTKCSYVDFKMGSKVIKCNNRSIFTNSVSFFSGTTTRCFLNCKKGQKSFRRLKLTCLLLKEPLWKHPLMDFTKTNIVSFVQL